MAESFLSEVLLDREPDEAGRQVSDLIWGIFFTPVTLAIANLGFPGVLAEKSLTAAEVAAAAGTDPGATARLLRAGLAVGLVSADSGGRYSLTEMGGWLRPDVSALSDMAGFWQGPAVTAFGAIADHVKSGQKVDPAAPGGFWEWLGHHPEEAARFSRAMGFVTSRVLAALAGSGYRLPAAGRVVDVGGSRGTLLAWLLHDMPEATGVLYDLAGSLAAAPGFLAAERVADRTEIVEGSFLDHVPDGDVHVISNVLHNWGDEHVRQVAANCARAARPGGWLVVIEPTIPSVPEPAMGQLMDILMMVMFGGRERALEEHRALIEPAGYALERDVPLPLGTIGTQAPWRLMEFRRT